MVLKQVNGLVKPPTLCEALAEIPPSFNVHTVQCFFAVFLNLLMEMKRLMLEQD